MQQFPGMDKYIDCELLTASPVFFPPVHLQVGILIFQAPGKLLTAPFFKNLVKEVFPFIIFLARISSGQYIVLN